MRYLVCNTSSYGNTDYVKPITVHKSTDYRTSTGTNHRFIPPFPQDFDARVKTKPLSIKNPIFKDDLYLTDNKRNFRVKKSVKNPLDLKTAEYFSKVHYLKNVEEKLFRNPPRPIPAGNSEVQSEYTRKSAPNEYAHVLPPNPNQVCEIRAFGRDEQPPFRPGENGYYKLLDIYLTTNRVSYVPYSQAKLDGIGRKDIVTYYDASNVPRGGKGYGPKTDSMVEPLVSRRIKPEPKKLKQNKMQTRKEVTDKFGGKSEYSDAYIPQTYSDFHPYLFTSGVSCPENLIDPGPWQTSAPPAMYCTETCHCGTGWPVRAVVEVKTPKKEYVHKMRGYCECVEPINGQ